MPVMTTPGCGSASVIGLWESGSPTFLPGVIGTRRTVERCLEAPVAPLGVHHVVDADEVVSEFREHRTVALVRAGRESRDFRVRLIHLIW